MIESLQWKVELEKKLCSHHNLYVVLLLFNMIVWQEVHVY